jgi:EF-P beta-lysylation protein EpmB
LAEAITSPRELLRILGLETHWHESLDRAADQFGLRVPRAFVARMRPGDLADPLLRQVLPVRAELESPADFSADPLAEQAYTRAPALLQKYAGRALIVTTGACGVHCRYCFRREYPYGEQHSGNPRLRETLQAIAADPSIHEVLLSGGDPLSLTDARLQELTAALEVMPHVQRIRLHTRQPVVLPARVDAGFLAWLEQVRKPVVIVMHVNHANEIDTAVSSAFARLRERGVTLLNQSVLLNGVNDSVDALVHLSEALFAAGVLPYYLHMLDRVRGASHFSVPDARALDLHAQVSARLAGYLVPRLVREIPGAPSKVPLLALP